MNTETIEYRNYIKLDNCFQVIYRNCILISYHTLELSEIFSLKFSMQISKQITFKSQTSNATLEFASI